MNHFPVVEISGTPYELGAAHGESLRAAIAVQLAETLAQARQPRDEALAWAETMIPRITAIGAHWIEELRGLAAGAGISLAEAAALQVRPGTGQMPEGCTSFGVSVDAAEMRSPLAGQTRDLVPCYRERMVMMLLRPTGRAAMWMHNVPGELGGTGINGHGVCVFANSLWARSGRTWMAPPILRRAVLECDSADEAVERVQAMNGPAVGNFLVVDRMGSIRNLEIVPEGVAVHAQDSGVYAHANNCCDTRLKAFETDPLPSPGSEGRRACLQRALEREAGELAVEPLTRLLSDHGGSPEPLCRHALRPKDLETCAALIAEPEDRRLHISFGPPCEGMFSLYTVP